MSLFRLGEINERYYRENIEMFYLIAKKTPDIQYPASRGRRDFRNLFPIANLKFKKSEIFLLT
ncbi:hypothetical protein ArsFIN_54820 (plasmid) [Arsenophonus nasoniae]|uniref:Uncharacterized protein n=1 Tax=Arsenophonus nasoniae TaxID=638 RepID=A0A4P7L2Q8_9GAMM|nr:hypothetical protein ArsFIN_54820 [Arsenophonus nasoniae]